jgi:hypothetical protein
MSAVMNIWRALVVRFAPVGNITATNVQDAIAQNDSRISTLDSQNVKITGNQTIAGNKTFSNTITGSADLSLGGNLSISTAASESRSITINTSVSGTVPSFKFQDAGNDRWEIMRSTSITGASLQIIAKNGASTIDTPITINRSAGQSIDITRPVNITNNTVATSTTTGALIVSGGIGVGGSIYTAGINSSGNIVAPFGYFGLLQASTVSGTNIAGNHLSIRGGGATGSAAPGSIQFHTSNVGSSGSTAQSFSEKARISGAGNLLIGISSDNATDKLQVSGSGIFSDVLKTAGRKIAFSTKTANYSVVVTDDFLAIDATSGTITITLPSAVNNTGQIFTIKKVDISANIVTVATTASQTIDGSSTYSLNTQYQAISVISNGSNWLVY